jgi:hypothetical protein
MIVLAAIGLIGLVAAMFLPANPVQPAVDPSPDELAGDRTLTRRG